MDEFATITRACLLLRDLPCPWYVCGGWAIDLFLDRVTRAHKDVDIAVARSDQFQVREYLRERGWELEKAIDGKLLPWADDEELRLPVHAVWCRHNDHDPNFIELLLNEIDGGQFRFRRDESVTLARQRMSFKTANGLPVLAPEIVLLYKSNCPDEYDADFQNTVGALKLESRAWLKAALRKLFAQHPWAESL